MLNDWQLMEAIGEDGREWDVALIRAGLSKNGNFYAPEVLREATPLFDGVRALARSDQAHLNDRDVHVKNIVGWYDQPRFEESEVRARFHLLDNELAGRMKEAWDRGKKDLVGFSIVADGKVSHRRENGRMVRYAEAIHKVDFVDVIVNPSAGGRVIRLIQADGPNEGGELEMLGKLIKMIEAQRPELLAGKDAANLSEEELNALLAEALKPVEVVKEKVVERPADTGELKDYVNAKLAEAECRTILAEKLAECKLPEITVGKLRKQFSGKIFTEADLDAAITEERQYLASFQEAGKVTGLGRAAEITLEERDKVLKSLDGFFEGEDLKIGDVKIPRFKSFKEAYTVITGDHNLTGQFKEAKNLARFSEAMTVSSWAQILGDSITRKMLAEYRVPTLQDWRKVVSDITAISDFRTNRRMRMGGYGTLSTVAEQGTYQEMTSPGDEEATYAITKKGGLESVTMEMIANDDVGAIRRIPTRLGRSAARTLYEAVFALFSANSGQGAALTLTGNTAYVFVSSNAHGNYATTALSHAGLNAVRYAMRTQAAFGDASEILGLTPKYILVPNELEELAFKLCMGPYTLVSAATTESSDAPNLHARDGLEYIVVDSWTDGTNWYSVCNPKDCPTIEVGFFQGREEPELFVQDQPTVGSMFSADKITYKIRHIWGLAILDYRGMAGNVVGG